MGVHSMVLQRCVVDDESENEVDGGAEVEKDIDEEAGVSGGNDTEDMAIDD